MPELYRLVEVSVYALLNFLPLAILAVYLLRNQLRCRTGIIVCLLCVLSLFQITIGIRLVFFPGRFLGMLSFGCTVVYAVSLLYAVKAPAGKTMFVLLFLSNIENYVVMLSKCLEGQLFPDLARQQYRWSFSFCMILVMTILGLPFYLYVKREIVPIIQLKHNDHDWRFLWLVPGVFYFIWYCIIYILNDVSTLEMALRPEVALFFTIFHLGALLAYYVTARMLKINEQNRILEEQKSIASIQLLQYQNLQEKIVETRRARHDMRHHAALMNGYLQEGQYDKLEEYLNRYTKIIYDAEAVQMCENVTVNVILLYFAGLAKVHEIDFDGEAVISSNTKVSETDLSVLFGNLLENAMDACLEKPEGNEKIVVRIRETTSSLCFTIDNTFHGEIKRTSDDRYMSAKHKGEGIGISSCRSIVENYHGIMDIEQSDGMFRVSVLLNYEQK